jgi:two-component system OmpR family response regulator
MSGSLRLLLVDDEAEFLEPTAARLTRRGIDCITVESGAEALRALATYPVDCAVVDVRMPGMDGLGLLQRIKRDRPALPVVLLTGHASIELGVRGMELGAFEYLLKPVDLDVLLDTIRRAVTVGAARRDKPA